jgi:3-hydroxy-9,10-secoandrosta-1,3,5(10)-triene-9,17-dione monooxygenase reductase component
MFDAHEYRKSLGVFATGVAIATSTDSQGGPVGLTINSFTSVSLAPPLILWSLRNTSSSLPVFERSEYFAINILAADQHRLSRRFSSAIADKFNGVSISPSQDRIPLIEGCAAQFECIRRRYYEEGDHVVFIGEVIRHSRTGRPHEPLVFCDGAYKRLGELRVG